MNTISYLAQKGRNQDVIAVNKAMIEILRDRLRIEISEVYDTVEQEISVTKQYLLIQDYRYEGIFKTKITIEDMAKSHLIAKNIIQPLVENALYGILENRDENGEVLGGLIEIAVTEQERQVKIVVKDNGAGMSQEQVDKILNQPHTNIRGEHIGIRNIRERVSYIYKESAKLNITSREGYGTIVCIKVPIV
jgi:sensor histidine kinase YesM